MKPERGIRSRIRVQPLPCARLSTQLTVPVDPKISRVPHRDTEAGAGCARNPRGPRAPGQAPDRRRKALRQCGQGCLRRTRGIRTFAVRRALGIAPSLETGRAGRVNSNRPIMPLSACVALGDEPQGGSRHNRMLAHRGERDARGHRTPSRSTPRAGLCVSARVRVLSRTARYSRRRRPTYIRPMPRAVSGVHINMPGAHEPRRPPPLDDSPAGFATVPSTTARSSSG